MKKKSLFLNLEFINKLAFVSLILLFIFLPFSSWIVSLSGNSSLSLIRDVLAVTIFVLALVGIFLGKKKVSWIYWFMLVFIVYGLISFFWKDTSVMQWLRGFRYTFGPVILLAGVSLSNLTETQKNWIYRVLIAGGIIVAFLALLELIGVKLPLTTSSSATGALVSQHLAGSLKVTRLQAVLAGPNALGLYMMALVGCALGVFRRFGKGNWLLLGLFLIVMILTFCRSALIGCLAMLLYVLFEYIKEKFNARAAILSVLVSLILLISAGYVIYGNTATRDLLTHYASSQDRVIEYQRIWDSRNEIGLIGRSMGTAGPASQYSLDGTPNHWTENIYLDTFEQLGLIGLVLWIGLFGILLVQAYKKKSELSKTAFVLLLAFAISGVFINIYTGQVGIYILFLMSGLSMMTISKTGL